MWAPEMIFTFLFPPSLQLDPSTLELVYYMDNTKKEKRGTVNIAKFVGLSPNAKVGNKDHAFALETEDRKYILRAPDAVTKNIWLAKLCEVCGQGQCGNVLWGWVCEYVNWSCVLVQL